MLRSAYRHIALFVLISFTVQATAQQTGQLSEIEQRNKAIATDFYEALWFSNNTDRYADFFEQEYVVHDIGDRKNLTEPAIEQKNIADFFHSNGSMSGEIDYQIAEGDLVATRWFWRMEPSSLLFRIMGGRNEIPIINVFRFNDSGKIVEIWNHRHDIDTGVANFKLLIGLMIGLVPALVALVLAWIYRRRWIKARAPG